MFAASKSGSVDAKDAQFNYVTMLLHGDGTNGAQNNTFLDSSTNNFTITRNGNTTQGTFTPYGSNWSANFASSSTDYLSAASNAAFAFGTGDFTMEAFVFATASQTDNWIIGLASNCWFRVGSGGALEFYNSVASTSTLASTALPLNTWTHAAVVRSGTALTIYQNGVSVGSATVSTNFSSSVACTIGNQVGFDRRFNGYISNARVVKGTAVYTSAFTPSTTPLTAISGTSLLTCADNRFVDDSTNNFTVTANGTPSVQRFSPFSPTSAYSTSVIGGSGYFDGSGDYLNVASNAAFGYGTGDFSLEFWAYPSALSDNNRVIFHTDDNFNLELVGSGVLQFFSGSGRSSSPYTYSAKAWSHFAITRQSGTARMFINGMLVNNFAFTSSKGTSALQLGANAGSSQFFGGYLSNIRIVKGGIPSAYVTASTTNGTQIFTPPTAPFTSSDSLSAGSVSLLANMTNAGILDNAMMNDLETVGNAQISTSVKKYGTGSMYFDGTDDRLNMPSSPNLAFGTGDFTLEMWAYFTSTANFPTLTDSRANTSSTAGFNLGLSSAKVQLYTTSQLLIGSSTLSANTWYHIAVTRASGTLKIWLNGVQDATVSNSTNWSDQTFIVGATPTPTNYMTGYIDDLRLTKGFCRYTTTFTPPTAAFADKG